MYPIKIVLHSQFLPSFAGQAALTKYIASMPVVALQELTASKGYTCM